MIDLSNEITAFVISAGNNPNFSNCLKALKNQTVKVKIEVIKDYTPMSRAFQEMLNRCSTKYYVEIDEDMILFENAIEQMHNTIIEIDKEENKISMVGYQLKDVHLDFIIYGVKIYKYEIFKMYPYNLECLSCEVEQLERMEKDGYSYKLIENVIGLHSPLWNNNNIFERYYDLMEKFKKFGYGWLEKLPLKLFDILKNDPTDKNLYALLGAYTSIINENIHDKEKDFTKNMVEFGKIESYMSSPASATVYVSSQCNYKCEWCYRQHDGIEDSPDMTIDIVKTLLRKFPTIKAICLCGFGEPFMSDDLKWIIQYLKTNNIFVGLITNGSLLTEKFNLLCPDESFYPHYISVSLNAHNKETHKQVNKTDTFDKVLEGIKMLLQYNINTFVSYVCTTENIKHVPAFLNLVESLGVKIVHLHNLLPHFNEDFNDGFYNLVLQKKDQYLIDEIKSLPNANLVKGYPILIDQNEIRRNCRFVNTSISVDGNGSIGLCNSVYPCKLQNGNIKDPVIWQNKYCQDFRNSILTEQKQACRKCFRNWEI